MDFQKEQEITCPECGKKHKVIMYERIQGNKQPELKDRLLKNELFQFTCEDCGVSMPMVYPCLYQDMDNGYMVWFTPASDEQMLAKIAAFNGNSLEDDTYKDMHRQYKLRLVTAVNRLIEKILIFDEEMDDRAIEIQKVMLVAQLGQLEQYKNDTVRAIYFELRNGGGYGYTVLFQTSEKLSLKMDMDQYYKIYLGNKQKLQKNTPEGFALIQEDWGISQFQEIMKLSIKSNGGHKKRG